jgi:hypothetical protein
LTIRHQSEVAARRRSSPELRRSAGASHSRRSTSTPILATCLPMTRAGKSHPAQTAGLWLVVAPSLAIRPSPGRASCPPLRDPAWARSSSRHARITGHAGSGVAPFGLGIVPGVGRGVRPRPDSLRPPRELGGARFVSSKKTSGGSLRSRLRDSWGLRGGASEGLPGLACRPRAVPALPVPTSFGPGPGIVPGSGGLPARPALARVADFPAAKDGRGPSRPRTAPPWPGPRHDAAETRRRQDAAAGRSRAVAPSPRGNGPTRRGTPGCFI